MAWRSDHTAIAACGVYEQLGTMVLRAEVVRREPQGLSPAEAMAALKQVWDEFTSPMGPRLLVVDASGNLPVFHGIVASGFADRVAGVQITSARQHALAPEPVAVPLPSGKRKGAALWHLSRNRLIEDLDAAGEQGLIAIDPGCRDAGLLKGEMAALIREVTDAGNVRYITPEGGHDDLVVALALALWAVPYLRPGRGAGPARQQPSRPSWLAWT